MEPKPDWLKIRAQRGQNNIEVEAILKHLALHTVCEEAKCPNMMECFNRRTATFLILGKYCTRNCTFCNVEKANPLRVDPTEPFHIAQAVKELQLKHVVLTSVSRDDLLDGGAGQFARVIMEVRKLTPTITIEVLIPDFKGDRLALAKVVMTEPEIINHNIETIPRLYDEVRPKADYWRSLVLLENVKKIKNSVLTKSGMMVGLGETEQEVIEVLTDLRRIDCDMLTIGQYLAPSKKHHPVVNYVHPDIFKKYSEIGIAMGFKHVNSGPLVRSSYQAEQVF